MGIKLGLLGLAEFLLRELWSGECPGTERAQTEEGRTAPAPPTYPFPLATCSVTLIKSGPCSRPQFAPL